MAYWCPERIETTAFIPRRSIFGGSRQVRFDTIENKPPSPVRQQHYHHQQRSLWQPASVPSSGRIQPLASSTVLIIIGDDDDDDENENNEEEEEEEEEEEQEGVDVYRQAAASEFEDLSGKNTTNEGVNQSSSLSSSSSSSSSALATIPMGSGSGPTTSIDWGGALGTLRQRMEDVETGKSQDPSQALFRIMSSQSPNQVIGQFISSANPQVVTAMSGAVSSLLGGLSNPTMGVETVVKASGEKIGSLCFQLQMTGYVTCCIWKILEFL